MDLCQRSDLTKLTEGSGQDAGTQKKDEGAAGDDALPHALLGQVLSSVVVCKQQRPVSSALCAHEVAPSIATLTPAAESWWLWLDAEQRAWNKRRVRDCISTPSSLRSGLMQRTYTLEFQVEGVSWWLGGKNTRYDKSEIASKPGGGPMQVTDPDPPQSSGCGCRRDIHGCLRNMACGQLNNNSSLPT